VDVLKTVGGPGSIGFLFLCLFVAVVVLFVWPRSRRLAKHWLLWVSGVYLVLGLPVVADAIARSLPAVAQRGHDTTRVRTLIVLDGDNRRGRLSETVRFLKSHPTAALWVLGEEWLVEGLIRAGYPRRTFGHETKSRNTREQMAWVERFMAAEPDSRPAILASRLQMPRVARLAEAAGLDVVLVASPLDVEPPVGGWRRLVPRYSALRASRDALYEHAALRYYRSQGWIGPDHR
jgi:uncharacterized SAM-binding protein YcdF (DUF218 family)